MAEEKKDVNAIVVGLVGAAVGAAVAAGSIALADEKKRKKLQELLSEIKDRGSKVIDIVQKEAENMGQLSNGKSTKGKSKNKKS